MIFSNVLNFCMEYSGEEESQSQQVNIPATNHKDDYIPGGENKMASVLSLPFQTLYIFP